MDDLQDTSPESQENEMEIDHGTSQLEDNLENVDDNNEGNAKSNSGLPRKNSGTKCSSSDGVIGGTFPAPLEFSNETQEFKEKRKRLETLLKMNLVPQKELKKAALSKGGFVDDEIRKRAWPLVLGLTDLTSSPMPSDETLQQHSEYQQVVLDVNRSLRRFPPSIPEKQRLSLQDQLTKLILRVVISHPRLRYYQGYHDVAVTLLLVTGEDAAFFLLEHLSNRHLKDCMEPTMEKTSHLLNYIYPLVKHQNKKVYEHLEKAELGTMFALPWLLTWFGHSLNRYHDVVRLYDYFLASEPLAPLYLSSVIVVHRAKEILATPCDMASLHSLLSQIPDDMPFETLLEKTTALYKKLPPKKVEEEVKKRILEEQMQRQMQIALRQQRLHRNGSLMWRWLYRLDPIRRMPLWVFPHPNIPVHLRRLHFVMATAIAFGVGAYYVRAVTAHPDDR